MIYFLGDVHGRFAHILPAVLKRRDSSTSVVFLGDIELQRPFEEQIRSLTDAGVDVWFIHGNHDTDHHRNWQHLAGSMHRNLDGRILEIEGVKIAGLGGVFREKVWYPRESSVNTPVDGIRNYGEFLKGLKHRVPPREHDSIADSNNALKHLSSIFPETFESLAAHSADVLVTHEAPSCHRHGFAAIDQLARCLKVRSVFHGHHHDSQDYGAHESRLGFRAFGVGYCGITDLNGLKVVDGKFDNQRNSQL